MLAEHRLDLKAAEKVIVENKAVRDLDPVFFAIVRSYLKATGLEVALLFNFCSIPLTIKRIGPEIVSKRSGPRGLEFPS
jgi:GxxExxY protein